MRKYLLILLLVLPIQSILADDIDKYWAREDELNTTFVNNLSKSVVLLENATVGSFQTGVLIAGIAGDEDGRIFILTNNHLLKKQDDEVHAYISNQKNNPERFQAELIKATSTLDLAVFRLRADDQKIDDLISMGFTVNAASTSFTMPDTNFGLLCNYFVDPTTIRRGRSVLFLGFPMMAGTKYERIIQQYKVQGTGEVLNSTPQSHLIAKDPVARFGHISSSSDGSIFLIDAMVNHGNSGSPVFVRDGEVVGNLIKSKYLFAGIIRSFRADDIVYTSNDGQIISIPHNSGLAEVISVEAIRNFLKGL